MAPAVWHVATLARRENINKRKGEWKTMIETEKRRKCRGKYIHLEREGTREEKD